MYIYVNQHYIFFYVYVDDAALRRADNRFHFFEKDIENMAKGTFFELTFAFYEIKIIQVMAGYSSFFQIQMRSVFYKTNRLY